MNRTSRMNNIFHLRRFAGTVLLLLLSALPEGFLLKAQIAHDSLFYNTLNHFPEDPLHLEFHQQQHPSDSLFYRYVPSVDQDLIEDRVSCLDLDIPLVVNKTVCSFIHYFTVRKRNYTQTMLERKNYYFPIFEYYLRKYEMPDALKYLAIVESGLNYKAKSRVGAVGLWQFMPGTGRDFRLNQSAFHDQRQNPWLATEAACKFLKSLYGTFQDWELALAAYNCGPGNVMKAIRRSGKRGFWEIYNYLPQETKSYVPQFHAVVYSMNYAREHNIFPDIDSVLMTVPLDTFRVEKTCDLKKLECLIGLQARSLMHHNPEIKTNVFPGGTLLVPGSHSSILAANFDAFIDSARVELPKPEESVSSGMPKIYLKKGTNIRKLATRHGWNPEEFCRLNHISGDKIRKSGKYSVPVASVNQADSIAIGVPDSGSTRKNFVFAGETSPTKPAQHDLPTKSSRQNHSVKPIIKEASAKSDAGVKVIDNDFHEVAKGEGLYAVARMYGLALKQLRDWNPGIGDQLHKGQKIRIRPGEISPTPQDSLEKNTASLNSMEDCNSSNEYQQDSGISNTSRRIYMVQKGDTLYSITRKFNRLSMREIMRINKLKNKRLKPGQQLIVG